MAQMIRAIAPSVNYYGTIAKGGSPQTVNEALETKPWLVAE